MWRLDRHVKEYYQSFSDEALPGNFHAVVAIHERPEMDWDELYALAPSLPRGWYEVARLPSADRIEFVREFWMARLPYHPFLSEFLISFFGRLDDIGVFLSQSEPDGPWSCEMVYSLVDDGGFYHGYPAADEDALAELKGAFVGTILPEDYLAFLTIHENFRKCSDTGVLFSVDVEPVYKTFQKLLADQETVKTTAGEEVNPHSLIPFYDSFGMPCYQCFWADWYQEEEMGNVYYSGIEKTVSDTRDVEALVENLAFPTFVDWLMFYLEEIG